jgi:hypothetical protein
MRDKNMVYFGQFVYCQVADTSSRIDQYIVVNIEGGGAQFATNPTAATEHFDSH